MVASTPQQQMTSPQLERGLQNYLECETLLNTFFASVDYCLPECLTQKNGKYRVRMEMPGDPTFFPGEIGCCPRNGADICNFPYVAERALLDSRREEIYGKPKENPLACDYHGLQGCILKSHKPPVCLAYICPEFGEFLNQTYGIIYYGWAIERSLELILSGRQDSNEVEAFKKEIQEWIGRVKAVKQQRKKG